jgi:ribosomal protein S18 acetylase RimI-like enzyme
VLFRAAIEADLDRFLPLLVADPGCSTVTPQAYRLKLADEQYRFDRTWLAVDAAGVPRAVAVWWGAAHSAEPQALDGVFTDPALGTGPERTALAAALLRAAHRAFGTAPDYHVFLPSDWREQPAVGAALDWRLAAARQAGLTFELERLRFDWQAGQDELPAPARDLAFTAEPADEVFLDLFHRVTAGTLDHHSRTGSDRQGALAQAREDLAFYRDDMLGARAWWRLARNRAGEVVGFGIPSHNHAFPVVGYLGVLPEHRGHSYAQQILGEITRILVAETGGAEIRADTDRANRPMAEAFERAGYRRTACRLVLSTE